MEMDGLSLRPRCSPINSIFMLLTWAEVLSTRYLCLLLATIMHKLYRKFILRSLVVQVFLLLIACILTDGGQTLIGFIYGAFAYWFGVAMILRRKSTVPVSTDVMYLKYGLIVLSLLSCTLSPVIWALRSN